MTEILLHPGFHKTGTSSIQHFLWLNRAALAPHFTSVMLRHLKPAVQMACRFSRNRNPAELMDMVAALDAALAEAEVKPAQNILVSCEGLLGHLPGWPDVDDYGAAPTLAAYLTGYFQDRHPKARLRVILTTRDADGWLFSTYRHHLRGQRLTQTPDDFARTYAAAADLTGMAAQIADAVGDLPVFTLPLADLAHYPLGPGGALCDLMQVPSATRGDLVAVGHGNTGPEQALWEQFLALNRGPLGDRAVRAAKERLAEAVDLGGWRTA